VSVCTGLTCERTFKTSAPSETRSKRKICSVICGLCLLFYLFWGEALHCTLQAGIVERQLAKRVTAHDRSVVWHLQVADHVGRLQVSGPRMCKWTQSPEQHNTGKCIRVHAVNLKCTLSGRDFCPRPGQNQHTVGQPVSGILCSPTL